MAKVSLCDKFRNRKYIQNDYVILNSHTLKWFTFVHISFLKIWEVNLWSLRGMVHGANFDTLMNGYTLNFLSIMTFSDFQGHDSFFRLPKTHKSNNNCTNCHFRNKITRFDQKKRSKVSQGEKIQSIVHRTEK